jgi:hypothetical protein
LLVSGFIVADGSAVRFCELLLESMPPQCGGESFLLDGFDLEGRTDLDRSGGVTWSPGHIQLLGDLEGDVFTVDRLSQASS